MGDDGLHPEHLLSGALAALEPRAGAPHQAVLVDLAHERLYFFFIEIWPQEVYYITGLLILAAVWPVSDQRAVWPVVVRLFLPPDSMDRPVYLGRNQD